MIAFPETAKRAGPACMTVTYGCVAAFIVPHQPHEQNFCARFSLSAAVTKCQLMGEWRSSVCMCSICHWQCSRRRHKVWHNCLDDVLSTHSLRSVVFVYITQDFLSCCRTNCPYFARVASYTFSCCVALFASVYFLQARAFC